jgi:CubicO group peptidase (beta-lactamase class C family)
MLINFITTTNPHFCGVVIISQNNNFLYQKSSLNKPIEKQQFLIASLTKQFTAVLILKEMEKGNIDLFQKANTYLLPEQKISNDIEVHHLLNHSSGIIDSTNVPRDSSAFYPGTAYQYSNYAYKILGQILQNITKKTFNELTDALLVENNMQNSFCMDCSSFYDAVLKHPNLTISASITDDKEINNAFTRWKIESNPIGGIISTATDLDRWNHRLHGGSVISPQLYSVMVQKTIRVSEDVYYGYGVFLNSCEITHYGLVDGYKGTLSYFPKSKVSVVILESKSFDDLDKDFAMHKQIRTIANFF